MSRRHLDAGVRRGGAVHRQANEYASTTARRVYLQTNKFCFHRMNALPPAPDVRNGLALCQRRRRARRCRRSTNRIMPIVEYASAMSCGTDGPSTTLEVSGSLLKSMPFDAHLNRKATAM